MSLNTKQVFFCPYLCARAIACQSSENLDEMDFSENVLEGPGGGQGECVTGWQIG